jgi:hypothetical protein
MTLEHTDQSPNDSAMPSEADKNELCNRPYCFGERVKIVDLTAMLCFHPFVQPKTGRHGRLEIE